MAAEELEVKDSNSGFRSELQQLLNRHSKENGSNTPDFILADHLNRALESFDKAVLEREAWYGRTTEKVNYHGH